MDTPYVRYIGDAFGYFNFIRYIANGSTTSFQMTFYIILMLIIFLNIFLILGFIFKSIYWIETINQKYIG